MLPELGAPVKSSSISTRRFRRRKKISCGFRSLLCESEGQWATKQKLHFRGKDATRELRVSQAGPSGAAHTGLGRAELGRAHATTAPAHFATGVQTFGKYASKLHFQGRHRSYETHSKLAKAKAVPEKKSIPELSAAGKEGVCRSLWTPAPGSVEPRPGDAAGGGSAS